MFDRYDPWAALIKPSLEARFPLQAAVADGPAGTLPLSASGVAVATNASYLTTNTAGVVIAGGGSVLVTAFGANPDGPGTVLRLWEMAGITGERTVRLPAGLLAKTVQPVDLRGQPLGNPVTVQDGVFSLSLSAFAPASFVIPVTSPGGFSNRF